MKILKSAEEYLETMLVVKERLGTVRSVDVADELGVSKPSVSYATKRLRENGYITMDSSCRITLTDEGLEIAERVHARNKLIMEFLIDMGVGESVARKDACKIEQDISDQTFQVIQQLASRVHAEPEPSQQECSSRQALHLAGDGSPLAPPQQHQ